RLMFVSACGRPPVCSRPARRARRLAVAALARHAQRAPCLTTVGPFRTIAAARHRAEQRRNRMPRIRHLAIKTKDPARLAKFYEEVFGMKLIHSERSGAMYMSDGYLTLAILRNRGEATPSGTNHFGFQVDDLKDVEAKLGKWQEPMTERPS